MLVLVLLFALIVAGDNVLVALKHNPDALASFEERFWDISDPLRHSEHFGRFLTLEQVTQWLRVSDENVHRVSNWLQNKFGATEIQLLPSGDWLKVTVAPELAAELALQQNWETMRELIDTIVLPANYYSVPSAGLSKLQKQQIIASEVKVGATPSGTPTNQKEAYGIPLNLVGTNKNNSQIVWGPGTYGFLDSDLKLFYSLYNVTEDLSLLVHQGYLGVPGGDNFGECTLDVTCISSLAVGVKTIASNTDNSSAAEEGQGFGPALLAFASNLSSLPDQDLPLVWSQSLGSLSWDSCDMLCTEAASISGGDFTKADCDAYMQTQRQVCMYTSGDEEDRINTEFMKLGSRGMTITAATGDGGSHFSFGPFSPVTEIGRKLNTVSCEKNWPTFPAASPYVTGVGGTEWSQGQFNPIAWSRSGSGFSWRYSQPSYQTVDVNNYLKVAASDPLFPPSGAFNAQGRAYPDVATLASGIPMVLQGSVVNSGGTSAAAPEFSAIITLINDYRLNNGLAPLGFVNPRLYALNAKYPGQMFVDVTVGNSKTSCSTGFPSEAGWDPNTGLGSPIWDGLFKYLSTDSYL